MKGETLTDQQVAIDYLLETMNVSMAFDFATGYYPEWATKMNKYKVKIKRYSASISADVEVDYYTGSAIARPELRDVIYSLLSDLATWELADGDFKEWADSFGYNSDSIKDKNIFDLVTANRVKINQLFSANEILLLNVIYQDF